MAIINIDLRFVDVAYELWALREYREVLERQLVEIQSELQARLDARLADEADEDERSVAYQEHSELVDHILPRMFRCPLLVSLFAVYESSVTDVARYLRDRTRASLQLDDMRRTDFLDRAKLYFSEVLRFPLVRNESDWHQLQMLSTLRNLQAHANGRSSRASAKVLKRLAGWEHLGVELHYNRVEVNEKFLQKIVTVVSESLSDLVGRAKAV